MSASSGSRPKGEVKRFDVTLEGLRQLHQRVSEHQLEPDDWPLLGALVSQQIARAVELGLDCLRRHLQGLPVYERIDFEKVDEKA